MISVLEASDLHLAYGPDEALAGASIQLEPGVATALMGPSGSGKSSLLHCLCGAVVPDSGTVRLGDIEVNALNDKRRSRLRLRDFGVVFQFGDLVPELTLAENVALPLMLQGTRRREAMGRARELIERLGIAHVADAFAGQASGGQVQRAAVARAVIHRPRIVLADEPTGALDTVAGEQVLDLLIELCRDHGSTLLVVTHEHRVAAQLDRSVRIEDGRCEAVLAGVR